MTIFALPTSLNFSVGGKLHISRNLKALLLLSVSTLATPAFPQNAPAERPAVPATKSTERLNAGLEFGGGYDDNVYATRNREEHDFYLTVRPFVQVDLGSSRTTVKLRGEGEIGRYADLTSEDHGCARSPEHTRTPGRASQTLKSCPKLLQEGE